MKTFLKFTLFSVAVWFSNILIAEEGFDKFGEKVSKAINQQDLETLASVFNIKDFVKEAGKSFSSNKQERNSYGNVLLNKFDAEALLKKFFLNVFYTDYQAHHLRTVEWTKPLIRIDFSEGGHEYLLLFTKRNNNKEIYIYDFFVFSTGNTYSSSVGKSARTLLTSSTSFFEKVLGVNKIDEALVSKIKEIQAHKENGDFASAYHVLNSLDPSIKRSREILDMSIHLSSHVSQEEYSKQLALLDKYFGEDESTLFMLVDHHFLQGNYEKALASIDKLTARLGKDGALLNLKASIAYAAGQLSDAEQYAKMAILIEPSFQDSYWTLADTQLANQDYSGLVKTFQSLETDHHYHFTREIFEGNEEFKMFVKSDEFLAWFNS